MTNQKFTKCGLKTTKLHLQSKTQRHSVQPFSNSTSNDGLSHFSLKLTSIGTQKLPSTSSSRLIYFSFTVFYYVTANEMEINIKFYLAELLIRD